ncbi:DUF3899 domain-containing protein [Fictibacillus sp. FJAT-27399]|uniref:DUF3899 domain-containing protein n=1 Tax=Fictibacillus sp. FJAT-27399 TaxID=1729689 RepID=UPI000780D7C8|nr:DUF3899 domain-containing protein [Fictibacillus sp. FJAT-27399]
MRFLAAGLLSAGAWKAYMLLFDIKGIEAINQSFLLGLLFLVGGVGAIISGTGFLHPLTKVVRAANPVFFRKHYAVSAAEKEMAASIKERTLSNPAIFLLGIGTGLSVCSILLLILVY